MESAPEEELIRLERERCTAISASDITTLDRLLADDLSHTHASGLTQDKATYLAGVEGRPRLTTRGNDLRVCVYGNVAVMTGALRNTFPAAQPGGEPRLVELHALQVWVHGEGSWKQVAFASSGRPAADAGGPAAR